MLGRGLGKALFRRLPDETHGQGLRLLLGEHPAESPTVEQVVAQTALTVLGESFGLTCIVVARVVGGSRSLHAASIGDEPARSEVWSWALPSWTEQTPAAFELHGRLWQMLNDNADGVLGSIGQLHDGWVWLSTLNAASRECDDRLGAVAFRHRAFSPQESEALGQSLGALASVLSGGSAGEEGVRGDVFNGSGRLTVSDTSVTAAEALAETSAKVASCFEATIRVGQTRTATGRGETHVVAVARAAASALRPQPLVRFADDVAMGERTVTVVLLEAGEESAAGPTLHLGLSVRPAGDINGGAAAVFEAMGWPDGVAQVL